MITNRDPYSGDYTGAAWPDTAEVAGDDALEAKIAARRREMGGE